MINDRVGRANATRDDLIVDLRADERLLVDASLFVRDPSRYEAVLKPMVDRMGALLLLILFAPVIAACAMAVRVTMGAPVILRQSRVGLRGQVFTVYKFRTMEPDRRETEQHFEGPDRRVSHKRADDPRITTVGRILRKWSLDELPQFWNVLKGDMSLVGPRPELVSIVANYEPWQHRRHAVRPGITGLWQVSERGDRMLHEATDLDLAYIDRICLLQDLRILLVTPFIMLAIRPGS